MDNMDQLLKIASKAQYIADVAAAIASGRSLGIVDRALIADILRQLDNISDTLGEYHDWED